MIDVSDGLASEILHICKASKVGCHLYNEKIPIDTKTSMTAIDFNMDPSTCALNGGEDYELLFTVPIEDHDKVKTNPNLTVVGFVKEGTGANLITRDDKVIALKAQGFNHHQE